ncbi:MAG: serine/threonine protein phosphatase [Proteobacteria bacterium]|nr:serine/threonine protein phosphatase [Pseudomonadota bacterium]
MNSDEANLSGPIYAVGDVHGRLDLLELAWDAIGADAGGEPHSVVFLGDYVDRGPDSRGVVEFVMRAQAVGAATCLKGNHEQMMVDALRGAAPVRWWIGNGGDATLASYGGTVTPEHLDWMAALPLTHRDAHRVYVHAGLMPGVALERQDEEACLWIRERFLRAGPQELPAHVVHGHTPFWAGKPDPREPELLPHRTNLDTGAFMTGVLTVGVFDRGAAGGPVRLLRCGGPAQEF